MNNKTKVVIAFLTLVVVGGSLGFWYNSRLVQSKIDAAKVPSRAVITPSSSMTQNSSSTMAKSEIIKKGSFVRLDPAHYASGEVKIINEDGKLFVELQDNFATNPDGPDLHVWLVNKQNLGGAIGGVDTNKASYVDLGTLTKFKGIQRYSITQEDIQLTNYAVVIWCQAFNVQFSNAVLN
jgi:hypothetical protein